MQKQDRNRSRPGCLEEARSKAHNTFLTNQRLALEELTRRHRITRAYFFSQREFRDKFAIISPIGLCAGLAHVWWVELQKGHDAIANIHNATPAMIGHILLSQARSFYLREFPPNNRNLRSYEIDLLQFKYGEHSVPMIESLYELFGVK